MKVLSYSRILLVASVMLGLFIAYNATFAQHGLDLIGACDGCNGYDNAVCDRAAGEEGCCNVWKSCDAYGTNPGTKTSKTFCVGEPDCDGTAGSTCSVGDYCGWD